MGPGANAMHKESTQGRFRIEFADFVYWLFSRKNWFKNRHFSDADGDKPDRRFTSKSKERVVSLVKAKQPFLFGLAERLSNEGTRKIFEYDLFHTKYMRLILRVFFSVVT